MFSVVAALDFDEQGALSSSWQIEDDELWLQCAPGVLHARVLPVAS